MIKFFSPTEKDLIQYTFSIIVSRYQGHWVWVKHQDRNSWELPAGHVEPGETALQAAHRELFEETGALSYQICPIVSYQGELIGKTVFGKIFLSDIFELGPLPEFEIMEIGLFDQIPDNLTYPDIQPEFFKYVLENPEGGH